MNGTGDRTVERGLRVHGRVQGVGFRWWTKRTADRLGVTGWVRNRDDGSVELVASASPETLDHFETDVRRGPPLARVTEVESFDPGPAPPTSGFEIRR